MSSIELTIEPRERDLGDFTVRRVLPYAKRRMVGPFTFFDHMGPVDLQAGHGMDVRPHPHIGLATVTYLFSGEITHRDSIGSVQKIEPGAVNWMTAGRGIAHSERSPEDARQHAQHVHGLQSWVALPKEYEECAPEFFHHAADTLPEFEFKGAKLKLIAGRAFDHEAPVKLYSPLFYAEAHLPAEKTLTLTPEYRERALYLIAGKLRIGATEIQPRSMPIFASGDSITIEALEPSHFMMLGGEPLPEQRFMWWNFVSSSQDRIVQAQEDWKNQRFPAVINDTKEFIPLPE